MSYESEQKHLASLMQEVISDESDTESLFADNYLSDMYILSKFRVRHVWGFR